MQNKEGKIHYPWIAKQKLHIGYERSNKNYIGY